MSEKRLICAFFFWLLRYNFHQKPDCCNKAKESIAMQRSRKMLPFLFIFSCAGRRHAFARQAEGLRRQGPKP